jgi:Mg/Co/Ni transporter MgtE
VEQDIEVTINTVEELLRGKALKDAVQLVASIHPADQAELFWHLEPELREAFLALLSAEGLAHLLEYLDPDQRAVVVEKMPRASLARVLDRIDNDVAADILRARAIHYEHGPRGSSPSGACRRERRRHHDPWLRVPSQRDDHPGRY